MPWRLAYTLATVWQIVLGGLGIWFATRQTPGAVPLWLMVIYGYALGTMAVWGCVLFLESNAKWIHKRKAKHGTANQSHGPDHHA